MDLSDLHIRLYPDPVLTTVAQPVEKVDSGIRALSARMVELMYENDGIGLAAPQVGISKRLFVTRDPEDDAQTHVWVNPAMEVIDNTLESGTEGCLSLPDIDITVQRAVAIRITGLDLDGEQVVMESDAHIARVWQHELDHLDGRLIIDRMSTMDRLRCRRAIRAMVKQGG